VVFYVGKTIFLVLVVSTFGFGKCCFSIE